LRAQALRAARRGRAAGRARHRPVGRAQRASRVRVAVEVALAYQRLGVAAVVADQHLAARPGLDLDVAAVGVKDDLRALLVVDDHVAALAARRPVAAIGHRYDQRVRAVAVGEQDNRLGAGVGYAGQAVRLEALASRAIAPGHGLAGEHAELYELHLLAVVDEVHHGARDGVRDARRERAQEVAELVELVPGDRHQNAPVRSSFQAPSVLTVGSLTAGRNASGRTRLSWVTWPWSPIEYSTCEISMSPSTPIEGMNTRAIAFGAHSAPPPG